MASPTIPKEEVQVRMEPGKAAAFDRWMAQGGQLPGVESRGRGGRKVGIYSQGPMKGMTYDQAKQKFEQMWGSASPEIRAKYDARAAGPAPRIGNAELNASRPGETPAQTKARQKASRMGVKTPTAARPASDKKAVDAGGPVAVGTPEERARVAAMVSEGEGFATADTGDGGMRAAAAMEAAAKESGGYKFGFNIRKDVEAVANGVHGRGFAPNPAKAQAAPPSGEAPSAPAATGRPSGGYPVGRGRVGGVSASGQQGRISTGASPSAPVAVRNEVAANAGVKPVMPDQVAAAPAAAPQVAATKPTRINSLTGLPMGYRPGDAVAAPQQKAADESVNNQRMTEAFGGIDARPADIAAANGAMRSQGMVVRAPTAASMPRGPASQPVAAGPTKRADGYVARSPIEDTRMQMANERAARERVPTAANPPGLKLVGPKRPLDELVRRSTPPRAIPVG